MNLLEIMERELGPWSDWSIEAVLDSVPDGWAKVDGQWINMTDAGLYLEPDLAELPRNR